MNNLGRREGMEFLDEFIVHILHLNMLSLLSANLMNVVIQVS